MKPAGAATLFVVDDDAAARAGARDAAMDSFIEPFCHRLPIEVFG